MVIDYESQMSGANCSFLEVVIFSEKVQSV